MLFTLALKSLKWRLLTTTLCVLSIAMSVALFLGLQRVQSGAQEGFTNTVSQMDLLVGGRGSGLQLLLYSIFHLGTPSNNIRYSSYEKIKALPQVGVTIPISLGDSYRGYRVVATNKSFYDEYRFRGEEKLALESGTWEEGIFDVVLGSEVAKKLNHKLGDKLTLSHGVQEGSILTHSEGAFKVSGILRPSATPVDRGVYISLEGMEAIHIGWETGVPNEDSAVDLTQLKKEEIKIKQITSFLLKAKSRLYTLRLQRYVNDFPDEPMMGIIPALSLQELWTTLSYVEDILTLMSGCVFLVGLIGIILVLYTSLNERRREMAILRALGMGVGQVGLLLVMESVFLVFMGSLSGLVLLYGLLIGLKPYLENNFSVYLPIAPPNSTELMYLGVVILLGVLAGLLPAIKAYRQSLHDGLNLHF